MNRRDLTYVIYCLAVDAQSAATDLAKRTDASGIQKEFWEDVSDFFQRIQMRWNSRWNATEDRWSN